jgi:hypothetical protein
MVLKSAGQPLDQYVCTEGHTFVQNGQPYALTLRDPETGRTVDWCMRCLVNFFANGGVGMVKRDG